MTQEQSRGAQSVSSVLQRLAWIDATIITSCTMLGIGFTAAGLMIRAHYHIQSSISLGLASFAFGILSAVLIDLIRNTGDRRHQHEMYVSLQGRALAAERSFSEASTYIRRARISLEATARDLWSNAVMFGIAMPRLAQGEDLSFHIGGTAMTFVRADMFGCLRIVERRMNNGSFRIGDDEDDDVVRQLSSTGSILYGLLRDSSGQITADCFRHTFNAAVVERLLATYNYSGARASAEAALQLHNVTSRDYEQSGHIFDHYVEVLMDVADSKEALDPEETVWLRNRLALSVLCVYLEGFASQCPDIAALVDTALAMARSTVASAVLESAEKRLFSEGIWDDNDDDYILLQALCTLA